MNKILKYYFRTKDKIRFILFKFFYDFKPKGLIGNFNLNKTKNIIIIKYDNKLGDTEVLSPFIKGIKEHFPKITLTVICTEDLKETFQKWLKADKIIISSKKPIRKEIKYICSKITKNPDLLFTTQKNFRPRDFLFEYYLRPNYSAAFATNVNCVNLPMEYSNKLGTFYQAVNYLFESAGLSLNETEKKYIRFYDQKNIIAVSEEFPKISNTILINANGSSKSKAIHSETLYRIMNFIFINTNFYICLLNIKNQTELFERISKNTKQKKGSLVEKEEKQSFLRQCDERIVYCSRRITVTELSALIASSAAIISVDTSTVHLAEAADRPLLALYNGEDMLNSQRWMINGPKSSAILIKDISINNISFNQIRDSLVDLLNSARKY